MKLAGVYAPIPTPFDDRDRVDTTRLKKALTKWAARPLAGFVVLGSNGEAVLMDDVESDHAIAAARDAVPREKRFIVGTGRESTQATINATRRAAERGPDAVLVRTPGFFKAQMTNDAFVRHYTAVADASPVPVLLYNFTALTGVNLLPAAVARLATHPNIIGMKESGGDMAQVADLVSLTPDDFNVLAGSAPTFYAALCVGAVGGVLALGCAAPGSRGCSGRWTDRSRLPSRARARPAWKPPSRIWSATDRAPPSSSAGTSAIDWRRCASATAPPSRASTSNGAGRAIPMRCAGT